MKQIFIDQPGPAASPTGPNLREVLEIVQESLDEVDQARLVQALMPRLESGEVTPYSWMLRAYSLLVRAFQLMDEQQLSDWNGYEVVIRDCPLHEAQRIELPRHIVNIRRSGRSSDILC